jgi:hypothetical protein
VGAAAVAVAAVAPAAVGDDTPPVLGPGIRGPDAGKENGPDDRASTHLDLPWRRFAAHTHETLAGAGGFTRNQE